MPLRILGEGGLIGRETGTPTLSANRLGEGEFIFGSIALSGSQSFTNVNNKVTLHANSKVILRTNNKVMRYRWQGRTKSWRKH